MARNTSQLVQGLKAKNIDVIEDHPVVEPVTGNQDFKALIADEAFMNERVAILLHPTTDKNAATQVILSVNGEKAIVPRGVPGYVKRKHLEVLARMKETSYTQPLLQTGGLHEMGIESLVGQTAHAYPFMVIEDKNPRGGAWLMNVMAEAS